MASAFNANLLGLFVLILETSSRKWGIEIISEFIENFPQNDDSRLNEFALGLIQHCEEYISTFDDKSFELRFGDSNTSNSLIVNS